MQCATRDYFYLPVSVNKPKIFLPYKNCEVQGHGFSSLCLKRCFFKLEAEAAVNILLQNEHECFFPLEFITPFFTMNNELDLLNWQIGQIFYSTT